MKIVGTKGILSIEDVNDTGCPACPSCAPYESCTLDPIMATGSSVSYGIRRSANKSGIDLPNVVGPLTK